MKNRITIDIDVHANKKYKYDSGKQAIVVTQTKVRRPKRLTKEYKRQNIQI